MLSQLEQAFDAGGFVTFGSISSARSFLTFKASRHTKYSNHFLLSRDTTPRPVSLE